jgi:L-galactose dehydrogenase
MKAKQPLALNLSAVIYRPLGQTGLNVSLLGFGCAPLGGPYGPTTQDSATQAVQAALDLGINFFDTAPWYGNSEELLGRALSGVPRESYVLCTKLGRYPVGPPMGTFDFSAARVRKSIDESLQKLRVEQLDIVHCHDIEFAEDQQQIIDETIPEIQKYVLAGKVRFVGVSGLPLEIFPFVLDQINLDVILSYCHCSLNDDSLNTLSGYFAAKNIGVIGASPLAMGLLSDSGPPDWHPAPETLKAACREAIAYCLGRGVSLAELALSWSLQNSNISTMLVGMSDANLVRKNIATVGTVPDPDVLAGVEAILASVKNLSWPSGRLV